MAAGLITQLLRRLPVLAGAARAVVSLLPCLKSSLSTWTSAVFLQELVPIYLSINTQSPNKNDDSLLDHSAASEPVQLRRSYQSRQPRRCWRKLLKESCPPGPRPADFWKVRTKRFHTQSKLFLEAAGYPVI